MGEGTHRSMQAAQDLLEETEPEPVDTPDPDFTIWFDDVIRFAPEIKQEQVATKKYANKL